MPEYHDRWIDCTSDAVRIRGYYFPWGTKVVQYQAIRSVVRQDLTLLSGGARVWGTGNFRSWLNLDPGRLHKTVGLVLDLGRRVSPMITPDDPDAVEAIIRARAALGPRNG